MGTPTVRLTVVLDVSGELDLHTAAEFSDQLFGASDSVPAQRVVLDLSGVTFMDVAGLCALTDARQRLRHRGKDVRLRGLPAAARGLWSRSGPTGAHRVLAVVPDVAPESCDCDEGVWSGAPPEPNPPMRIGE